MIRNYIKIAWRNLVKNKGFTFIHLIGLSTGFAITLLIAQYVIYEMSYEDYNPNADKIARVTTQYMNGSSIDSEDCEVVPPFVKLMAHDIPEVETSTRVYQLGEPIISFQLIDKVFNMEKVFAVDSVFLKMFHYPLKYGDGNNALKKTNEIVLTESTALKLFNKKDVVGEKLNMVFNQLKSPYTVVGVCPDSPSNTHLKFNVLVSYPSLLKDPVLQEIHGEKENNLDGNNTYGYVQLAQHVAFNQFQKAFANWSQKLIEDKKIENERYVVQNMSDIHLYSNKTFEPEQNGDGKTIYFLLIIALLVIVSAIVNYINLATSKALDRAKEVGIKKVVGSSKGQLQIQFILESFLICLLAGILAVLLVLLSKSAFLSISNLPESLDVLTQPSFWLLFGIMLFVSSLLSGIYPAFVLSSFKPIKVLTGKFSQSQGGVILRKGLVVFQFVITIILLVQTFTVNEQLEFVRNEDAKTKVNNTIVVEAPALDKSATTFKVFKNKLLENSNVKYVASSSCVPGEPLSELSTTTGINLKGVDSEHNYNFYLTYIDESFTSLMGMTFLAGKNFTDTSANKNTIIVNEEAIKRWNIPSPKEAINKQVSYWGRDWTIVGVVKNYHQESSKAPFIPMIHIYWDIFRSVASVQFNNGSPAEQIEQLKQAYASVYPNTPFEYSFLDETYEKQYKADMQFQKVFSILTAFAILIACLGLLGLASFSVTKRRKEIGVRKVIGASVTNILVLLSKDFLKTVMMAVLIGLPITYFTVNRWLNNFAFKMEVTWWLFAVPILFLLCFVVLAIGFKTVKTATDNPVKSLRTE